MRKQNRRGLSRIASLARQEDNIAAVTWSPDGEVIAVSSRLGIVSLWQVHTWKCLWQVEIGTYHAYTARWSPNGRQLAVSGDNQFILILDADTGSTRLIIDVLQSITPPQNRQFGVMGLDWSPDGRTLVSGSTVGLHMWDSRDGTLIHAFQGQADINKVLFSPDGRLIASISYEDTTCIWDAQKRDLLQRHITTYYPALAWSPDSLLLAIGQGTSIEVRDVQRNVIAQILEAHSEWVKNLGFSPDGRFLVSRSGTEDDGDDPRVLIWRCDEWKICTALDVSSGFYIFSGLCFSPKEHLLAASTEKNTVSIWQFEPDALMQMSANVKVIYYKNAKIALVGNSGVGKSGLALVLSEELFRATDSTHGRRISDFHREEFRHSEYKHEIREAVLWDLAGQPGYRLIHQLHLDDVEVGVIIFDSKDETDPLSGIRHWNRALDRAITSDTGTNSVSQKILVAARIDRGPIGVSRERISRLMNELNVQAYIETSAKEGIGVEELARAIRDAIPWHQLPTISSNQKFQAVREFTSLRRHAGVLLTTKDELLSSFLQTTGLRISSVLFQACIERLQRLGLVRKFSFGNLILLRPELLDSYAAAILFAAKREPDGMGAIGIGFVKPENLSIPSSDRLVTLEQEQLLLAGTIEDLLRHEVALKESSPEGEILIFPSELTRENPDLPDPDGKTLKITFTGPIINIYASLVVRLSHSELFKMHELWRNAAIFKDDSGETSGFLLLENGDGEADLILFSQASRERASHVHFERYAISHVLQRATVGSVEVERFTFCSEPSCKTLISTESIDRRRKRGFDWIACNICDTRMALPDLMQQDTQQAAPALQNVIINEAAIATKERSADYVSASGELLSPNFITWAGGKRATVALVFSDIVGSTALGLQLGDEDMSHVRRLHFRQARMLISLRGGYEIKTIGDSFMVAFRTATEGLEFMLDLLRNPGPSSLTLRAGMHVGPVVIDENDAFGNMVNYASRVVGSVAGAGIRVSDRAHQDLLSQRAAAFREMTWTSTMVETFKGFSGPQTLWDGEYAQS